MVSTRNARRLLARAHELVGSLELQALGNIARGRSSDRHFRRRAEALLQHQQIGGSERGIAHAAHLGGLLFGYIYLHSGRGGLAAEIKYRYLKWKMNRLRRKFDVYSGGRGDWDRHVH